MSSDRFSGKVIVGVCIAFNTVFLGLATAGLSIGLIVAYLIWRDWKWQADGKRVLYPYVLTLGGFILHFAEEYFTDFYVAFPRLIGDSWSARSFLIFNLVWFAVFALSVVGLWYERPVAYLVVIFFALAGGIANGAAHILISLWQGRYFPGTATAPLMLAGGLILFQRLRA